MRIDYVLNLVILSTKFILKKEGEIDLGKTFQYFRNKTGCKALIYKGSCILKFKNYTLRITKNSYISLYIKNNFARVLSNSKKIISNIHLFLGSFSPLQENTSILIEVKNIQLAFKIIFMGEENRGFIQFCETLVRIFNGNYNFEIKEANTLDFAWLPLRSEKQIPREKDFAYFRIRSLKENNTTIFSFSHFYQGTCLTRSLRDFLSLCREIIESYK